MTRSTTSPFAALASVPRDPILGQSERFAADKSPSKVNLAVGMYFDDTGQIPQLKSIAKARDQVERETFSNGYLPIDGLMSYRQSTQQLVFGNSLQANGRVVATAQTLGGTGALSMGAEFLARVDPSRAVLVSDPSWENHRSIFETCGFAVAAYPYYDPVTRQVDVGRMLQCLATAEAGIIVVLHASCHNPTGLDLTSSDWAQVVSICVKRGLVAFVDMAYQGFGGDLAADRSCVEQLTTSGASLLVASSNSKNMSLYRERVGALSVVCSDDAEAFLVQGHLKQIARSRYSNPPAFGARLASRVLTDPALRDAWEQELASMRDRIRSVRQELKERLEVRGVPGGADHLTKQRGMFSYTGLSETQMSRLRAEHGIYGLDSGRICVAAINSSNIGVAVDALALVMSSA